MEGASYCLNCNSVKEELISICERCNSYKVMKFPNSIAEFSKTLKDVYIVKIKNKDILEKLSNGMLYCNSPSIYHDYIGAGQNVISDRYENLEYKRSLSDKEKDLIKKLITTEIKPYGYIFTKINGGHVYFFNDMHKYRLHCFYSISTDKEGNIVGEISDRIKKFGDSFMVIDIYEVIKRIKRYIPKNVSFSFGPVKYVNYESYNGHLDITCKDINFKYQNEYRFVFYSNEFIENTPFIINLRNIENYCSKIYDISTLYKVKNINELI